MDLFCLQGYFLKWPKIIFRSLIMFAPLILKTDLFQQIRLTLRIIIE